MTRILMEAQFAEANARLLCRLEKELGAAGFGAIGGFFDVDADWRCPCCHRLKAEIARLDKNGNLCCPVVRHHDHFEECVADHIDYRSMGKLAWGLRETLDNSFVRFQPTMICGDCNVAEPVAKAIVKAPAEFSFTPFEIAIFIDVTPSNPHVVDPDRAVQAYEAATPAMKLLANKLRAIVKVKKYGEDAWEPLAGAAWRVIKDARRNMKDAAESSE
jgi:rubredoxin